MRRLLALILSGLLLILIITSQSLKRFADVLPFWMDNYSVRKGIWYNARLMKPPAVEVLSSDINGNEIQIIRDTHGAIHIFAQNDLDAYWAWGFISAKERFFQLQVLRAMSTGSLAKMLGPIALPLDKTIYNVGLPEATARQHEIINPEERELLDAYSKGLNFHISRMTEDAYPIIIKLKNLPIDYWRPQHSIAILKFFDLTQSFNTLDVHYELARNILGAEQFERFYRMNRSTEGSLGTSVAPVDLYSMAGVVREWRRILDRWNMTSEPELNNLHFALNDSKTTTGGSLMYGAQHGGFSLPSILLEMHIHTPTTNTYGMSLAGAPFLVQGINDHLAWSYLKPGDDVANIVNVSENEEGLLKTRIYDLAVAGGAETSHSTTFWNNYPLVSQGANRLAVQWNGQHTAHDFEGMNALMHARSGYEARRSFLSFGNMGSFMVADRQNGVERLRIKPQFDPVTGLASPSDALGRGKELEIVPLRSGRLTNLGMDSQHFVDARHTRLNQLFSLKERHSLEDFFRYSNDVGTGYAQLRPVFDRVLSKNNEKDWAQINTYFATWDLGATFDSKLTSMLYTFIELMRKNVWDELGVELEGALPNDQIWIDLLFSNPNHPIFDQVQTSERETGWMLAEAALREAYRLNLIENGNVQTWNWAATNSINVDSFVEEAFPNLIQLPSVPKSGFIDTINPSFSINGDYGLVSAMIFDLRPSGVSAYVNTFSLNSEDAPDREVIANLEFWSQQKFRVIDRASTPEELRVQSRILIRGVAQ